MTSDRDGQVVTFYSYKGGTGRTMALANVAWILASNGYRVLAIDWDLESPGLHRFFQPFLDPRLLASTSGVVDMINRYEWESSKPEWDPAHVGDYAAVRQHSFSLKWEHFPPGGTLDFLSAGRQSPVYEGVLSNINWDDFYQDGDGDGGRFFDALRADMKARYDFTLIDSRTGNSDIAGICTNHLPDVLVDCFTFSGQGIEGAARLARHLHSSRDIRVLPVPMRVDPAEKHKADIGRTVAMREFAELPSGLDPAQRRAYWHGVEVPYQAYYAYEETLATFGDTPGALGTLLSAYEALAYRITDGRVSSMPPINPSLRAQFVTRFERKPFSEADTVLLSGAGMDQVWLEWARHILTNGGLEVAAPPPVSGDALEAMPVNVLHVRIISRAETVDEHTGADRPELRAVYTADITPWSRVPAAQSAFIAGCDAATAATRILEIVGRPAVDLDVVLSGAPRYPGDEPELVVSLPARNARFTGRETNLLTLRDQLRSGSAVVLFGTQAVALQGMGGVGKTQLALEYAYRYRAAYDVVAWLNADTEESLQGSLRDLGSRLNLHSEQTGPDYARAVVQELSRGRRRWLLILDNADEPDAVRTYLPHGGHVLITSRNKAWGEQTQPFEVDVFTRDESIDHLMQRVAAIDRVDADRVAEQLADLPIAVAAAAAWLDETHTSVDEYLRLIQEEGPSAVLTAETDRPIARTWDLSLTRLRDRDPAAYRLFQLCSVLAPEISTDLIFSDQMAAYLKPYKPSLSERMVRGSLIQQINRLALSRLDQRPASAGDGDRSGRVLIHRVVQNVVRDRMTDEELAQARLEVHQVLAKARPEDGDVADPDYWPRFRMLWPHLDASGAVHSTDESVRQLLIDRIRYYYVQAEPITGRNRAERIAAIWEQQLAGTTDPEQASALWLQLLQLRFNLANLIRDLGEFETSRQMDEEVLAEQKRLLGPEHPHTLMTQGSYAADLRGLGRYPEALKLDIETYKTWQDTYGEDYTRTLSARNNLAVSYRLMGLFREAGDHDKEVWERRRAMDGETNIWALGTAGCLARDMRDAGEFSRSAALLKQTLEYLVDTRGPDSRSTLTTKSNYAVSLRSLGRIGEALQLHQEAYARLLEVFGAANPETVSCRFSLALTLLGAGQGDQAVAELLDVHEFWQRRLGDRHPYTLVCKTDLAIAERQLGRFGEARDWIRPTAEAFAEVLGPEHPYTLSGLMNLAIVQTEPSEEAGTGPATARETLLGIAGGIRRVFGTDHPNTFRFEANLALVEETLGVEAADDRLAALRERIVVRLGENHPLVDGLDRRRYLYRTIDPHQF